MLLDFFTAPYLNSLTKLAYKIHDTAESGKGSALFIERVLRKSFRLLAFGIFGFDIYLHSLTLLHQTLLL